MDLTQLMQLASEADGLVEYDGEKHILVYRRNSKLGNRTLATFEMERHRRYRGNNFVFEYHEAALLKFCLKHDVAIIQRQQRRK